MSGPDVQALRDRFAEAVESWDEANAALRAASTTQTEAKNLLDSRWHALAVALPRPTEGQAPTPRWAVRSTSWSLPEHQAVAPLWRRRLNLSGPNDRAEVEIVQYWDGETATCSEPEFQLDSTCFWLADMRELMEDLDFLRTTVGHGLEDGS
jgi:hypothetical protein